MMRDILTLAVPSDAMLYTAALIFFRITGFFLPLPVLGSGSVPARIKIILILSMTFLFFSNMPSLIPPPHFLNMLIFCAKEFILGVAFGFVFLCMVQVVFLAGEIISMQMGLSFATLVDPESSISSPIVGQFFHVMMILLFLSMNAHLALFSLFHQSITTMPLGDFLFSSHFFQDVFDLLSTMMMLALLISMPILIVLLMMNLSTGIMSKAASQLNIFAIGLPVSLLVGLFILMSTVGQWGDQIILLITKGLTQTADIMG